MERKGIGLITRSIYTIQASQFQIYTIFKKVKKLRVTILKRAPGISLRK